MSESLSKPHIRKRYQERLDRILVPEGFKFSGGHYRRKIPSGSQTLSLAIFDYRPRFEFTVSLGIRIDEVEDFLVPFTGVREEDRRTTLTTLTQLDHFIPATDPGRGVLYKCTSEVELQNGLQQLAELVEARIVPFFHHYNSLEAVASGLNPIGAEFLDRPIWPIDHSRFDGSTEPYRAMHGIAVAFLTKDPRLPNLINAYRGQLSGMIVEIQAQYEKLASWIESR
jgi:hypothetical protein